MLMFLCVLGAVGEGVEARAPDETGRLHGERGDESEQGVRAA